MLTYWIAATGHETGSGISHVIVSFRAWPAATAVHSRCCVCVRVIGCICVCHLLINRSFARDQDAFLGRRHDVT